VKLFNDDPIGFANLTDGYSSITGIAPATVKALSLCFPQLPGGLNAFAEALATNGTCSDIARRALMEPSAYEGHMAYSAAWFLGQKKSADDETTLLDLMRMPDKHVFHVAKENFDDDFAAMWQWLCFSTAPQTVSVHDEYEGRVQERHDDIELSEVGRTALANALVDEYYSLRELSALSENKLSDPTTGLPL